MTASLQNVVTQITRDFLTPLCKASADLLKPIRLAPNDRLMLTLSEDASCFIAQAYAIVGGNHVQASWEARYKWAERCPERKELGGNRWELAATDTTALIINACWPRERIDFQGGAEAVYDYVLTRFLSQSVAGQQRALFKLQGRVPEMPKGFFDHPEKPLETYQRVAFVGCLHQEGSALYMAQGTGKTPIVIRRVCHEAHEHHAVEPLNARKEKRKRRLYQVLICCPKNVRANWQNELHQFCTVPGKVCVLRGNQIERVKLLVDVLQPDDDSEFAVVIASYETVKRSWEAMSMIQWDLCVADESHYIAATYTDRTKTFLQLRDCCRQRMVLTGTPVKQRLLDLWSQFEFLGEGLSGFKSWRAYHKFYGQYDDDKKAKADAAKARFMPPQAREAQDGLDATDMNKYSNIPLLQERLSRLAFMITKEEALPYLPKKTYDIHEVTMLPEQREYYIKLMRQLALEIEEGLEKKTMTAQNALVRLLRLTQITSGFAVFDPQLSEEGDVISATSTKFFDPNPKIDGLMELLADKPKTSKTLIWACFKNDIQAISDALTKAGIKHGTYTGSTCDADRAKVEWEFNNDPEMRVFVGNAVAGGTGLNLRGYNPDKVSTRPTAAEWFAGEHGGDWCAWYPDYVEDEPVDEDHGCNADHVIYFSQNWSAVARSQSEDRAHRRGTRVPVRYTDLVVPNTIDEEIRARVTQKLMNAMQLQDVRAIMKKVLSTIPELD